MTKKSALVKKVAAKKVVKKENPKKTVKTVKKTVKPVKKEVVKKEESNIFAKQVGKNLIVIIDGKKYTKIAPTQVELTSIKTKILLFNKTKSTSKKEELMRLIDKTVAIKETKEAVRKGVKTSIKKEVKENKKEIAKIKEVEKDKMGLIDELSEKASKDGLNKEETQKLKELMKLAGFVEATQKVEAVVSSFKRNGEY